MISSFWHLRQLRIYELKQWLCRWKWSPNCFNQYMTNNTSSCLSYPCLLILINCYTIVQRWWKFPKISNVFPSNSLSRFRYSISLRHQSRFWISPNAFNSAINQQATRFDLSSFEFSKGSRSISIRSIKICRIELHLGHALVRSFIPP